MPIKTPGKTKENKRQNRHSEIRLSGVPPIMPIKTLNNEKKIKIDHQKYVYQGSPYYVYKTHNNNKKITLKKRPSEIR